LSTITGREFLGWLHGVSWVIKILFYYSGNKTRTYIYLVSSSFISRSISLLAWNIVYVFFFIVWILSNWQINIISTLTAEYIPLSHQIHEPAHIPLLHGSLITS
jgi:hypothetical protein